MDIVSAFQKVSTKPDQVQDRGSRAWFNVVADDYISAFYDEPASPKARYVFYSDETISGSVRLLNASESDDLVVTIPSSSPLLFRWLGQAGGQLPEVQSPNEVFVDAFGARSPAEFGREVHVPSHSELVLPFTVSVSNVTEGLHQLEIHPRGWVSTKPIIEDYGVLNFEVRRPRELPQRLDHLYRQAQKGLLTNDLSQASTAIDSMLSVYPDSALAYSLRAQVAQRYGRKLEAEQATGKAKQLLSDKRDQLYLKRPQKLTQN